MKIELTMNEVRAIVSAIELATTVAVNTPTKGETTTDRMAYAIAGKHLLMRLQDAVAADAAAQAQVE